jgi:hypothetical protein
MTPPGARRRRHHHPNTRLVTDAATDDQPSGPAGAALPCRAVRHVPEVLNPRLHLDIPLACWLPHGHTGRHITPVTAVDGTVVAESTVWAWDDRGHVIQLAPPAGLILLTPGPARGP